VGTAAALHVAASIPNSFIQEIPFPLDKRDQQMRRELVGGDLEVATDGFWPCLKDRGWGFASMRTP
jgi:L-alanine-DL-glutamate epimerase-like enolase superfamily enzyme